MSELLALGREHMPRCNELAKKGAGRVSPNPLVGALVLDSSGRVVGEGHHKRAGGPHAEVFALRDAGRKARGGTLIVNLEPCNHHGRTPPCSEAVLAAGIKRVIFGAADPIAGHSGGGRKLRRAGVVVKGGVLRSQSEDVNRIFFTNARLGRPHVVAKAAASLDGKSATGSGESKWITSEKARADGRALRGELDAIAVGIGTVLADDPALTARRRGALDPTRVIFDRSLRTPSRSAVLPQNSASSSSCLIIGGSGASKSAERRLSKLGAEVLRFDDGTTLASVLSVLHQRLVTSVLIEGGPTLLGAFFEEDLVDELRLYQAPIVIGADGRDWLGGSSASAALADATRFELIEHTRIGADLKSTALRRR